MAVIKFLSTIVSTLVIIALISHGKTTVECSSASGDEIDTVFDIYFEHDARGEPTRIVCSSSSPAHVCAKRTCEEHNLSDTVEGFDCVEILHDEILALRSRSRERSPGAMHALPNDYDDGRQVRVYSNFLDNSNSFRRFCSIHKLSEEICLKIGDDAAKAFGLSAGSLQVNHGGGNGVSSNNFNSSSSDNIGTSSPYAYLPIILDDYRTLSDASTDPPTAFSFRAHHNVDLLAQRFCAMKAAGRLLPEPNLRKCSTTQVAEFLAASPPPTSAPPQPPAAKRQLLSLSIGPVNGWTSYKPHAVNKRMLRVFEGEDVSRSAANFCSYEHCPDRVNTVALLADVVSERLANHSIAAPRYPPSSTKPRMVISLTSLPSRLPHLSQTISHMLKQDTLPDKIYINLPLFSTREQIPYIIPDHITSYIDALEPPQRSLITILRPPNDYGPATKLIPTLDVETSPDTIIVTIDDDVIYPSFYLSELKQAALRYPNAAIGFKGYQFPRATAQEKEEEDDDEEEGMQGLRSPASIFNESTFIYVESSNHTNDAYVDVLGGFLGVAYRSGFFNTYKLKDYQSYEQGAFYVDDDWIGGCLGESNIRKIVLGRKSAPLTSEFMFSEAVISPVSEIYSLNGKREFRNKEFQKQLLERFSRERAFPPLPSTFLQVYDEDYFDLLDLRKDSFRKVFAILESRSQEFYRIVETGTAFGTDKWLQSGQSTLLFDKFLNFGDNDGIVHSVDLDPASCAVSKNITSGKVSVHAGDSVEFLRDLKDNLERNDEFIDLIYLDSWDVTEDNWKGGDGADLEPSTHALKELQAILPRLRKDGGILLVDDNMPEHLTAADDVREAFKRTHGLALPWQYEEGEGRRIRGKGRLVADFMRTQTDCEVLFWGWQLAWIC